MYVTMEILLQYTEVLVGVIGLIFVILTYNNNRNNKK